MIPFQCDIAIEAPHWQRYTYFRSWYADAFIIDAGCGEGYGIAYAGAFAQTAIGIDETTIEEAQAKYPHVELIQADASEVEYRDADVVLCFELLDRVEDPKALLQSIVESQGKIAISIEIGRRWNIKEFKDLIEGNFPERPTHFLFQDESWPGTLKRSVTNPKHITAVIGAEELPTWPRIGLAMPTVDETDQAVQAILTLTKTYPGDVEFAIVTNGTQKDNLQKLKNLEAAAPYMVHLIEEPTNTGYGAASNKGLDYLWQNGWFDYFGVVNDDVVPATDCVSQMVVAMQELEASGQKPGILGPVSNEVSGSQRIEIGAYGNLPDMIDLSAKYHLHHHSSATQAMQVRGLFFLLHPDCLSDIGGFDSRFGLGNFEDDDLNVRARLAGYSLWIAEGAFLHHAGSSTFKSLNLDYQANIQRNLNAFLDKWGIAKFEHAFVVEGANQPLFIPLNSKKVSSGYSINYNGESLDLVHQASDIEFAGWIVSKLKGRNPEERLPILRMLSQDAA